jgi:hypothetical protein
MKSIICFALVLALVYCSPLSTYKDGNLIKFDLDVYQDAPVGLLMSGQIDPRDEKMNKIQTFLKLADQYIPILESLAEKNNELKWERTWIINFAGFNLELFAYFELIVGWRVNPGGYTADRFDVTYTPFVWGTTYASINGTSWLAAGTTEVAVQYVNAYAPIALRLYNEGRVCFQGSYAAESFHLRQHIDVALTECRDEIFDDLLNGHTIFDFRCNLTEEVNVNIFDINFTDPIRGDFISETCIGF